MEILSIKAINGPNIFHPKPVLIMRLDLGEFAETASTDLLGFNSRLASLFPGLIEHTCSPGKRGGFLERLARGTYPAHIIEHIAIELSTIAEIEVSYGKSTYDGEPGRYKIVTTFRHREGMEECLRSAVEIYSKIARNEELSLDTFLKRIKETILDNSLGPSGQALMDAALARKIPVRRIGPASLLELGYGVKRRRVQAAVSDRTSLIATELVQDKALTKELLKNAFVPVPKGGAARTESELRQLLADVPAPWVIKPLDGHHGEGVALDIRTVQDAVAAFFAAREFSSLVLVEQMMAGRDYRLLVINGKLVAAAERTPAHVDGDGVLSIRELVDRENADPRRGEGHQNLLTKLPADETTQEVLLKQGYNWASVPEKGSRILLRRTANISTGGTARDVTKEVHPEIRELVERVAAIADLDICGIDLIHSDIRRPVDDETSVIEVNAGPGLRMHFAPTLGEPQDVAGAIIESLYPPGDDGRIPIVGITGTNGKTTVTRLLAHVMSQAGKTVGHTTSNGIYVGGKQIADGDTTGPISALAVLTDPRVDFAVLETARGGIMRGGLAYDHADAAIITNIRADHIGQDGIESVDDIVHVKSVVAEQVKEGGLVVLNADDEEAAKLAQKKRVSRNKTICFYSLSIDNPLTEEARRSGCCSYYLNAGWLTESKGDTETRIVHVSDIPFTFGGTSDYQVSNALAVIAAARGFGVSYEIIRRALQSFVPQTQNLGRGTLYKIGQGHLLLDYGHNPDAIGAVVSTVRGWNPRRIVGVLGLPGDRSDELITQSAVIAAKGFDRLILRDDYDRRGRAVGQVPLMALQAAEKTNALCETSVILDECQAIASTIEALNPGDVAVVFYDELETALEVLRRYDPEPVTDLPDFSELIYLEKDLDESHETSYAHT